MLPSDKAVLLRLDRLPLLALTDCLRQIGYDLLASVLNGEPVSLIERLSSKHLDAIITAERLDDPAPAPEPGDSYKKLVHGAIYEKAPLESEWRETFNREIANHIGAHTGQRWPEDLWAAVGEVAWRDLEFQYRCAALIDTALSQRTWMKIGEFRTITLSPNTFWLLIAIASADAMHTETRLARTIRTASIAIRRASLRRFGVETTARLTNATEGPRKAMSGFGARLFGPEHYQTLTRQQRAVLETLKRKGEEYAFHDDWAALWDQWVLLEAQTSWKIDPLADGKHTYVSAVMRAMPLSRRIRRSVVEPLTIMSGVPQIAASDWVYDMPQWFVDWKGIKVER